MCIFFYCYFVLWCDAHQDRLFTYHQNRFRNNCSRKRQWEYKSRCLLFEADVIQVSKYHSPGRSVMYCCTNFLLYEMLQEWPGVVFSKENSSLPNNNWIFGDFHGSHFSSTQLEDCYPIDEHIT